LYKVNGPVNLVRLNQLIDQADGAALHFPRFDPRWPEAQWPRDAVGVRAAAAR
jgi:polyphosphate kinase